MNELKTCFKKVDYDLSGLLHYIDIGDIGLPDIQRPFVWSNAKVRDLFDSMYRGFPVGYLLFWANGAVDGARQIGTDGKQKAPNLLIVDGQQRLTSLYSVLRGKRVLDSDYKSRQIEIAFRPRDEKFEVADAAIRIVQPQTQDGTEHGLVERDRRLAPAYAHVRIHLVDTAGLGLGRRLRHRKPRCWL